MLLQLSFLNCSHVTVAVVGFVETLVDVNETDGQATLNIAVSAPQDGIEFAFSLIVESMVGSAGTIDIPQCCESFVMSVLLIIIIRV